MAAAIEDGDTARYLRHSIQQAVLDIELWRAPARGLKRVEATLIRFRLDSMMPPDRPYLMLAETYLAAGKLERARALLAEYELANDPSQRQRDVSERHRLLGELARAEGRLEDAVSEFRQQAARDKCRICPSLSFGRAYDQARAPDSAIAAYERYVITPYIGRIDQDALELANVLKRLGELHEARGELERPEDTSNASSSSGRIATRSSARTWPRLDGGSNLYPASPDSSGLWGARLA